MERHEVEILLKRRATLLSQPYGPDAVKAWHEELHTVPTAHAMKALHDLVHDGHATVTAADVIRLAVDKQANKHRPAETRYPFGSDHPEHPDYREPGCECYPDTKGAWQLCAMHTERATRWLGIIERGREERRTRL